jgi:hypothetical protein
MRFWQKNIDGMHAFYLNGMFRSLVFALVGIFTPVFLYKMGLSWFSDARLAIIVVAGYYILMRLTTLLLVVSISRIIEKIGFRKSIAISLLFLILNLGSLLFLDANLWLAVVAGVAAGLNISFYWVARNSAVSQDSNRKHIGTQMGYMTTIEQVSTLLGPLVAGLIIEKWGFQYLYALALLVLLVSVVPLFHMPPHAHRNGATLGGFFRWLSDTRYAHIGVGIGARAVDDYAINALWPLVIFVIGIKTGMLGMVFSGVATVSLFVRMLAGKVFDKLRSRRDFSDELIYSLSAIVNSVMWILRLFVGSLSGILMIDLSGALFGTVYSSFYVNYEQLGGERMGSIAYWVYGEMMYSIMTIGLFVAVGISAWYGVWREVFSIMAAFWVVVSIVIARESNIK